MHFASNFQGGNITQLLCKEVCPLHRRNGTSQKYHGVSVLSHTLHTVINTTPLSSRLVTTIDHYVVYWQVSFGGWWKKSSLKNTWNKVFCFSRSLLPSPHEWGKKTACLSMYMFHLLGQVAAFREPCVPSSYSSCCLHKIKTPSEKEDGIGN